MQRAVVHKVTGVITNLIDIDDFEVDELHEIRSIDPSWAFQRPKVHKMLADGSIVEATDDDIDASGIDHPRKWARREARLKRVDDALKALAEFGTNKARQDEYYIALYDLEHGS